MPLFFLLYINDLPNATDSLPRLFADDTCLILSHPSFFQLEKNINQDLANVSRWAKTNKLTINPTKSHLLVASSYLNKPSPDALITLDSSILKVEKSIKYLGINVDNQLLFGNHTNQLRTTVSLAVNPSMLRKKWFNFGIFLYNVQWVSSTESLSVEKIFASFELDEIWPVPYMFHWAFTCTHFALVNQ